MPLTNTRNYGQNDVLRQLTAKTILEEESKNMSLDRNLVDLGIKNRQSNQNNQSLNQAQTAYAPSPFLIKSGQKPEESAANEQVMPKPMFPEILEKKEDKVSAVKTIQKDIEELEGNADYAQTPLLQKEIGDLKKSTTLVKEFSPAVKIVEQDAQEMPSPGLPLPGNLIAENNMFESNDLIEGLEPKNDENEDKPSPADAANTKIRKLKSKKLRRRRKTNKPRYRNVINFFKH